MTTILTQGAHEDLEEKRKKRKKLNRAVRRMLKKHREADQSGTVDVERRVVQEKQIETLRAASLKIKRHLNETDEKVGSRGKSNKGNITDNDSAKMKTSHGVIQGYNGVAAVDQRHQIII